MIKNFIEYGNMYLSRKKHYIRNLRLGKYAVFEPKNSVDSSRLAIVTRPKYTHCHPDNLSYGYHPIIRDK